MKVPDIYEKMNTLRYTLGDETFISEMIDFMSKDDCLKFIDSVERNWQVKA